MYCLRCGRETEDEQAFCLECQKEMAKYPVDPNAVVQIPVRKQISPKKAVKRKVTPEEQIKFLKRCLRLYACLFLIAVITLIFLSIPMIRYYGEQHFQIGQNYTTVKPTSETVEVTINPQ